ncbi:DUF6804 family protein [Patescibacteria group bacterium]
MGKSKEPRGESWKYFLEKNRRELLSKEDREIEETADRAFDFIVFEIKSGKKKDKIIKEVSKEFEFSKKDSEKYFKIVQEKVAKEKELEEKEAQKSEEKEKTRLFKNNRKQTEELENPIGIILKIISVFLLFLAMGDNPYSYYIFLKWAIFISMAVSVYLAANKERVGWAWTFGIIGILYNPIFPIYLRDKDLWNFIDLVIIGILIWNIVYLFKQNSDRKT